MTPEQFKSLNRGDIIRNCGSSISYVVDGRYGQCVIAIRTVSATIPDEWELCVFEQKTNLAKAIGKNDGVP